MTLKQFAETSDLNYQTAKTWLRRGKIREVSAGEFQLAEAGAKPEAESPNLKPETQIEGVTPASPIESCARCESLAAEVSALVDRVISLEYERASLNDPARRLADLERQTDTLADLESRIAALECAPRSGAHQPSTLPHGQTIRRNGRAEIVDGDYLESQRWE